MVEEQFIDAEEPYHKDENSYENVIIKQIDSCVKILSKEVKGGGMKKTKQGYEYEEDVRELIINSVQTLEYLMGFFINKEFKPQIDEIKKNINKKWEELGEKEIYIKGKGKAKMKNVKNISPNNIIFLEFKEYKAEKYREIFRILMEGYQKKKKDIASLSVE